MPEVRRLAPAKLNLTLDILGRRDDGYHEIRSVLSTISFFDTLSVAEGHGCVVTAAEEYDSLGLPSGANETNTVELALGLIAARWLQIAGRGAAEPQVALREALGQIALRLHKVIPAAAGLGGGSSDATAALLALDEFWQLNLSEAKMTALAAVIGSDCPFFLRGGVQLAVGRGERLTPLPSPASAWLCLLKPPLHLPGKTAHVYSLLREGHYSDGARTAALSERLRRAPGAVLTPADLSNTFDSVADAAFGSLKAYRDALRDSGARAVHLCGAGPSLYGLYADEAGSRRAEVALRADGHQAWAVHAPAG